MHADEIAIDGTLVRRLLAGQHPDFAAGPISVVRSTGTVNAIFRLGQEHYARLPRAKTWAESLERELAWLPRLWPHLPLTIPQPVVRGEPADYYPCPWAVFKWIEGDPYNDTVIDDERQAALDLAGFVRELRAVDIAGAPRAGRRPLAELDGITRAAIAELAGTLDSGAVLSAWAQSLAGAAWDRQPVWIHADLLRPNLLAADGRLKAVLDFGSAGAGDPAFDIIPAWSVFNPTGRVVFRRALDVDDDTWLRARGYALHQALLIMPYYAQSNPEFAALARRTVEQVLADSAPDGAGRAPGQGPRRRPAG